MATNEQVVAFFKLIGPLAVAECNRRIASGQPFILPSVCIAQASLETGYGTAGIMTRANAFFGIKAGGSWTGKVYTANTKEVKDGVEYNTVANFRAYDSLAESLADYYSLMTGASRYSKALSSGSDRSQWLTARQTLTALWQGGYATDELYVQKNMNIIEPRNLTDWDMLVDGVGGDSIEEITIPTNLFINGTYIVQDDALSPRPISNSLYIPYGQFVKVDRAEYYTIHLKVTDPGPYVITFAGVDNGKAFIYANDMLNQNPVTPDEEGYIHFIRWMDPDVEQTIMIRYEETMKDISPSVVESGTIDLYLPGYDPDLSNSVLAFFVKVE